MSASLSFFLTRDNLRTCALMGLVWVLVYTWLIRRKQQKKGDLPPGPPAWPLVGSLPYLGSDIREPLRCLSEKYGPVITVYLGGAPAVVLNSYDVIKEAFTLQGHAFAGRPHNKIIEKYMTYGYGVVETEGKLWRDHRRFALSVLRDFGVGKPIIEQKIQEECTNFLQNLAANADKPFDPARLIECAVYNIINSITTGYRAEYDDPRLEVKLKSLHLAFYQVFLSFLIPWYDWLVHVVPFDLFGFWECVATIKKVKAILRDEYEDHVKTLQPGVTRDMLDAYLHEVPNHQDDEENTFTADQVMGVVGDLYSAGTETTSTTLRWAIIYMLHYPEVQERVQKEIDDFIGRETTPSVRDRLKLPYTEATVLEIGRMATIVPLGVPHQTLEDVEFRGYVIPKHTLIMSNLYSVHRDANLWTEPYRFLPDRFLKENEHPNKNKRDSLVPFSIGKRACLGEGLAKMELFLFFTSMMQKFTFRQPPGRPLPSLVGTLGSTQCPDNFEVIIEERT